MGQALPVILWVVWVFFSPSSVDTFRPVQPFLVKVKVDRGEQYKIAYRWPLAELKLVDGKSLDQVGPIFLLWQRAQLVLGERYGYEAGESWARIHGDWGPLELRPWV